MVSGVRCGGVAEIVRVGPAREARTRGRLDATMSTLRSAAQLRAEEREGDAGEIGPAAGAADDDVRVVVGHFHLLHRFLPDHGLVQENVVQHAAERVLGVVALRGDLDRLADRDAEAARVVGALREDRAARLRFVRRRRDAPRAVGLHQRAAVRLLVDSDTRTMNTWTSSPNSVPANASDAAPLARAGLGGQTLDAGFLVVERLRHRGVRLVAAGRADALVLVVDVRRRLQHLLEPPRAVQRRRPPLPVDVAHRAGNLDLALGRDLLHDQRHRKQRREVVGTERLQRTRVQRRRQRLRQVGLQVVPEPRDPRFVEDVLDGVVHGVPRARR